MDKYKITFQTWNKIADLYQEKFMDSTLYNDSYAAFCKVIPTTAAKILEIGCGPGNITRYLIQQRPDFQLTAIDIAPNMLALAKKNVPKAKLLEMDARNIHTLNEKFDGICCGFCLPYLSKDDCLKLLQDSFNLLSSNGLLYLSFIEGNYNDSGYEQGSSGDQVFVYYHSSSQIKAALKQFHFEILQISSLDYPKGGTQQQHIIFIAKKKHILSQ